MAIKFLNESIKLVESMVRKMLSESRSVKNK